MQTPNPAEDIKTPLLEDAQELTRLDSTLKKKETIIRPQDLRNGSIDTVFKYLAQQGKNAQSATPLFTNGLCQMSPSGSLVYYDDDRNKLAIRNLQNNKDVLLADTENES